VGGAVTLAALYLPGMRAVERVGVPTPGDTRPYGSRA
jgi:hypothetical protein